MEMGSDKSLAFDAPTLLLPRQYVDWSSMVPGSTVPVRAMGHSPREDTGEEKARHALFWSDPLCKAMYRAHAQRLTHRRNVFSG